MLYKNLSRKSFVKAFLRGGICSHGDGGIIRTFVDPRRCLRVRHFSAEEMAADNPVIYGKKEKIPRVSPDLIEIMRGLSTFRRNWKRILALFPKIVSQIGITQIDRENLSWSCFNRELITKKKKMHCRNNLSSLRLEPVKRQSQIHSLSIFKMLEEAYECLAIGA